MGCNCGGKTAKNGGPTQYRLTYPDGRVQVYLQEDQARREAVRSGGTVEVVQP